MLYNGRGAAYFDMGHIGRSIEDFDRAIHIEPDFAYAYNNRAMSYIRLGRYEEAEQDVRRAVELGLDPQEAIAELEGRL